jgi:hypothetical protein
VTEPRARPRRRSRELAWSLLAAFAIATLAFLTPPTLFDAADWQRLHLPMKQFAARALRDGQLPLWNPYVALGRPFLADIEAAVLYPPNLLYVVLDPASALFLLTVAHLLLALVGMLRLGAALGASPAASALAAISFALGAPLAARLDAGQVGYFQGTCYLPILFFLAARLQDAPSPPRIAALATGLGLQLLCGHPQIAWITWLGLGAFALGRASFAGRRDVRRAVTAGSALALALVLGLGLAAALLLPFSELASQGNRLAPTMRFAAGGSMEWRDWASLFVPDAGRRLFYWESNLYVGVLGAIAGLVGLTRVRDASTRGLALAAVLGGLVAAGPRTPAFSPLFHLLPGFASFHIHSRAGVLVSFALLVGAAQLLSRGGTPRRLAIRLGAGVAIAAGVSLASLWRFPPADGRAARALAAHILVLCASGALAFALACGEERLRKLAVRGLLVVAAVDGLAAHLEAKRAWVWPQPPVTRGERLLRAELQRDGLLAPGREPPRVALPRYVVRENAGMVYGWASVTGYGSLTLDRVWRYLHESVDLAPSEDENTYVPARFYDRGPFPLAEAAQAVGWAPETRSWVVRSKVDPRAFVVSAVRKVGDWPEALEVMAGGYDVRAAALVSEEDVGAVGALPPAATPTGAADIVSFERESVALRARADRPGLLVLKEAWYPGWEATVDGRPAACIPVNGWMRAVPIPAGAHDVLLRYHSRRLPAGIALSLATALLIGLGPLLARRARPGSGRGGSSARTGGSPSARELADDDREVIARGHPAGEGEDGLPEVPNDGARRLLAVGADDLERALGPERGAVE